MLKNCGGCFKLVANAFLSFLLVANACEMSDILKLNDVKYRVVNPLENLSSDADGSVTKCVIRILQTREPGRVRLRCSSRRHRPAGVRAPPGGGRYRRLLREEDTDAAGRKAEFEWNCKWSTACRVNFYGKHCERKKYKEQPGARPGSMLDSCLALLYFLCSILHHQSPQLSFIRPVPGKLLKFCQQFLKHLLMANLREITPPNANGRPDPL